MMGRYRRQHTVGVVFCLQKKKLWAASMTHETLELNKSNDFKKYDIF